VDSLLVSLPGAISGQSWIFSERILQVSGRFTAAYDLTRQTAGSYKFATIWHQFMTDQVGFKLIFDSADGPKNARATGLDKLRAKLKDSPKADADLMLEMVGVSATGTQALTDDQAKAAASVKLARHLYLQSEKGAQSVWIYAQPYSFHKWVHEEIKGMTPGNAKAKLAKADEVYPDQTRKNLGNGVNNALAWCDKCVSVLGTPNAATTAMIKRWFFFADPDDTAAENAAKTLLDGFKKIAALLKTNNLIFSDDPTDRMKGSTVAGQTHYKSNWNDYAFVIRGERLDVVYIQNATLKKWGSADEAWMATLAIIHELTHRVLGTKDVVYDFKGLKPSAKLTYTHAIKNADTWAYFAADINSKVPDSARQKYYKEAANLRPQYLNSLTN